MSHKTLSQNKTTHTEEISNRLQFYEQSKQNKKLCHEIINKKVIIEDNININNDNLSNESNENEINQNAVGNQKSKTKRGARGRKNKGGIVNSEASQIAHRNLKAAEKRDKMEIP